ncbi:MAG: lamin tail domain-containing protein [Flavobacteriales bacterium]|nr:lamin tail domain-containing protein [Flavobacteriales bacterium]
MKSFKLLLFLALAILPALSYSQILTFEFNGLAGSEATASSNSNDPNLGVSTISRGSGLTASGNGNRFNATSWATTSIATAVSGNDYMEFTITPNAGYGFAVTSIAVNFQRSGTGTRELALRSSVDGYTSNIGTNFNITDNTNVQTHTFTVAQSTLSSAVTYRFYGWAEATGGSGGFEGTGDDIVVNGTVVSTGGSPAISVSPTSLTGFSTTSGTPSASQSYTLSGSNLSPASGNITVTAPTDFEVSLDNSSFSATVNVAYTGGTLSSTTVYTRIASTASAGAPSGNITNAGGGATTQTVAVDGAVTAPITACSELFISEYHEAASGNEKYIEIFNPTGSAVTLTGTYDLVNYGNGSTTVSSTLSLTGSIPAYGTVYAANTSAVLAGGAIATDASVMGFNGNDVIALRKNGTNIDVVGTIGSSANFAQNVYLRRNATVDQPVTTYNASEWTSGAANDVSDLGSYTNDCVPAIPLLTVSPASLTGFQTSSGTASASQNFSLTGSDLTPASGNLTISAPTGFEVSTNNSTFSASVNVAYAGGSASQTIYVRIASTASAGNPSGNVTCSGGGATSTDVAVDGTVCPAPSGNFNVGDISIVGYSTDAPDAFAFVNWVAIPNGATLFFTDNAYENGALATNENTVEWNNNTGNAIPVGTVIVYTDGSGFDLGTDASGNINGLSASQDNLFIYEGSALCPEFVFGFSNNPWRTSGSVSTNDSYLPAALNVANGNLNVTSEDNWQYSAPRNDQATIAAYKPLVNNTSNWTGDDNPFTLSSTDFIIASANPGVEISASQASGSEAATSSITITATASSAVSGDQTIQLNISGTGITAGDYTISNSGIITILDGQTTGTATFTIVDDAGVEGNETATISYNAGGISSGLTLGTVTSLDIDIVDNDGTVLYSQTSGGTNSAIWDIVPNGTPQPATNFGGFSEFMDVVIQSGHTVDLTVSGHDMKSLTVQTGGKIYANNTGSPEYIDLFGNVVNNGTIGNGNVVDQISFNIKGSGTITFSGTGSYSLGRLRNDVAPTGTVIIASDMNLNWAGACIYNNTSNSTFNLTINAGKTVELTDPLGDVSIDGTDGTAGTERGGVYSIFGTLIIPNELYAFSNNSSIACGMIVWPAGKVVVKNTTVNIDGVGFTTFALHPGSTFEVNGTMSVLAGGIDSNGSLTLNSGATLLHGSGTPGGGGTVSDNVIVKRQGASGNQYNFWSTPVNNGPNVPGYQIHAYNSNLGTMDYSDDENDPGWFGFGGSMVNGVGYASKQAGLASFFGPVNNGNISTPIVSYPFIPGNTDSGTPFNYVGNPYPGALNASAFVLANSNIAGSIYFWDDDLSGGSGYSYTDYATWNGTGSIGTGAGTTAPNGFIASCQGFVVRALSSGNINFTNSMRASGSNNVFFRQSDENGRMWLSLDGEGLYNEILIGMIPESTESEDRLYDAVKLRGNQHISLASVNENREYSIMAFPHPLDEKVVPLNIMVGQNGTYHFNPFRMENLDGYDIYFEDTKRENLVLLSEETEIEVALTEGEYINRFFLHFVPRSTTGIEENELADITVYSNSGQTYLTLNGNAQQGTLEIMGANGQRVVSQRNATLSSAPYMLETRTLATGIYVVRFTTDDAQFVTRFLKN